MKVTQLVLAGAFLTLLAFAPAGCKMQKLPTVDDLFHSSSKPSPEEQVAMAFDPDNADKRREGVTMLSEQRWGLKEPYLAGYANLLANDHDARVRSVAARALGRAGDPNYTAALATALSDPVVMVRWDVAVALDNVPGPAAVDPLRDHAMADTSPDVRAACATALQRYNTPEAKRALVTCLSDPELAVRYHAHEALVHSTGRDVGMEPKDWTPLIEVKDVSHVRK